ncbi:hypothetical protein LTR56_017782 [Elasticomyces elasticus]|nr:hypothetical protein LTR56_017782 [Elasticomyces elasticus]KAK3662283.1 hypothetical protein LTR22_006816 [Elasticomyces elasticus]KAK4924778.1 hypothetical protein LTR49_008227 [Elasticomyces elasticus]KAK5766816.1 hypothetical protein LTS12_002892 [Elasticomyces elasticus]
MAPSPASFQLPRDVFNQSMYTQLREIWFRGHTQTPVPDASLLKRWFSIGSLEERDAFDRECSSIASIPLAAIAPSELVLPPFKSYADDVKNAEIIASPFLNEVKEARQTDAETGAGTFLSLVLFLDQMPRNTLRRQDELPLVFNHYDRIARALVRSVLATDPNIMDQTTMGSRVYWTWLLLPFMHSEHLPTHELALKLERHWRQRDREPTEGPIAEFAARWIANEDEHIEPIKRFGRYPHRNQCLGRASTLEEMEYLTTTKNYGVKQEPAKDEL